MGVIPVAGMLGDLIGNVTMLGIGTSLLAVAAVRPPRRPQRRACASVLLAAGRA